MRTAAELASDLNNLNSNAVDDRYNGVTEKQIAFVMAEARKIQWTDRKPYRAGWWWHRNVFDDGTFGKKILMQLKICGNSFRWGSCDIHGIQGQWSDSPIPEVEEQ